MAQTYGQTRWFGDTSSQNVPAELTLEKLSAGEDIFPAGGGVVKSLGIQTIPGVKFTLNANPTPIYVGNSGTFQLDTDDKILITSLIFDGNLLANNEHAYVIIDYIMDNGA